MSGKGIKMEKKYVSDIIGEEYQNWAIGQLVFIEAPTGSGKTTAILENLVRYAAENGRKILYLVNRTILKMQLEQIIDTKVKVKLLREGKIAKENINRVIEFKMYQEIEAECKNSPEYLAEETTEYQYIIADECHYFLADATYNTYTQLSYEWLLNKGHDSVLVFISATITRIKAYILENQNISYQSIQIQNTKKEEMETNGLRACLKKGDMNCVNGSARLKEYQLKNDYSYVNFHVLEKHDSIAELITDSKGKWLVFVDSIETGIELNTLLEKRDIKSIFIDALRKENDYSVRKTIEEISKKEFFSETVLISTSVMDNGISIKDIGLRNLVIMADNKDEFIQMLGRKRMMNQIENLDVYIIKRDESEFKKKLKNVEKHLAFVIKNQEIGPLTILEKVMGSELYYSYAQHLYYPVLGGLALNELSFEQFAYLQEYYTAILKRFEDEGTYAFVKEQIEWTGKTNAQEIIKSSDANRLERVCNEIEKFVGDPFDINANLELREKIRLDVKSLLTDKLKDINDELKNQIVKDTTELEKVSYKVEYASKLGNTANEEKRNNLRPLTKERFNRIAEILRIPYRMNKEKELFSITKVEV